MIAILGARIWVQNHVSFADPVNLTTAGVGLIVAAANFKFATEGGLSFEGIAIGTAATLVLYHGMRSIARWRGTNVEAATPASVPGDRPHPVVEHQRGCRADRDALEAQTTLG